MTRQHISLLARRCRRLHDRQKMTVATTPPTMRLRVPPLPGRIGGSDATCQQRTHRQSYIYASPNQSECEREKGEETPEKHSNNNEMVELGCHTSLGKDASIAVEAWSFPSPYGIVWGSWKRGWGHHGPSMLDNEVQRIFMDHG